MQFVYFHDDFPSNFYAGMVFAKIASLLNKWPGEKYFGRYRFLPAFFLGGAAVEFAMIHWRPNDINFYERFKDKKAREAALFRYERLKEIEKL